MRRLSFYKVLLPVLALGFLVVLALRVKPLGGVHTTGGGEAPAVRTMATGIRAVDMLDGRKKLEIEAGEVQETPDGRIDLRDIRELKIFRDQLQPLIVQALSGEIDGAKGKRTMRFEQQVTLEDPDRELTLRIPALEIDEASGEARSLDRVRLEGAALWGEAESITYGLQDQPSRLGAPILETADGARVMARGAVLHDGLDDVELIDDVRATRGEEFLESQRLRVRRRADHSYERADASGGVSAAVALAAGGLVRVSAGELTVHCDERGEAQRLELRGDAELRRGAQRIAAGQLVARRLDTRGSLWRVEAQRDVQLQGEMAEGPTLLRAAAIEGLFDAAGTLLSAHAEGPVSTDGSALRAEAARANFDAAGGGRIELVGTPRHKARLAQQRSRVAAEHITTDPAGHRLLAERDVEATLLPQSAADGAGQVQLFDSSQAIHFVAAELDARNAGQQVAFRGAVRGWQGERNLAAERVTLDQVARTVVAEEDVTTRIPRQRGVAAAQQDYVQVSASRLDYSETEARGVFREEVRVQIAEGWLDAAEVEVALDSVSGTVQEVRASGQVKLEFRQPRDDRMPELVSGSCDRLVYRPDQQTVWLIGEQTPASVRRIGASTGTTTGRVLRYELDSGALEVDSGDSGPARIRTSG